MSTKRNANRTKKSEGLGDSIAKVTKATGIDKAVKTISKAVGIKDCGCEKRKEWANKTFPYVNAQKKCMNEEQYTFFKNFKEKHLSKGLQVSIPHDDMVKLIDLYNSIFQVDVQGCSDCNAGHFVKKLDLVYLSYEENRQTA